LLGVNENYFRLIKRAFTQLQVLLPGETAAPGTLTGKTGTPNPVTLGGGGLLDVTVNACSADWFPISGVIDTIALTCPDASVITAIPAAMVNGTVTFTGGVAFTATGTFTITATDTTTVTIPPVAFPVTVN
jgi:hypothetical protein